MRIALIYSSKTGNTKELAEVIKKRLLFQKHEVEVYLAENLPSHFHLNHYDAIIIGTFTWGNGDIPKEMKRVYEMFEKEQSDHIVTGVFGTGDRFYPHFCGAVDNFRDMLYANTDLAVTLKVELAPQKSDISRCELFVQKLTEKYNNKRVA